MRSKRKQKAARVSTAACAPKHTLLKTDVKKELVRGGKGRKRGGAGSRGLFSLQCFKLPGEKKKSTLSRYGEHK